MKKVIALLLVMCLIFGVTYITQFTGNDVVKDGGTEIPAMPLLFAHAEVKRDPTSDDPHERFFPGFFEKDLDNSVLFWFRNENPVEVSFGFRGFSCATCTNARVAVIPPEVLDEFVVRSSLPVLPVGFAGVPTLLPVVSGAELLPKLTWTDFGKDNFDLVVKVPPAKDGRPTWGILRIGFKAMELGAKAPMAVFYAQAAGTKIPTEYPFTIHFIGVESFDVTPKGFETGDLADGASPAKFDLNYWSVIRGPNELAPPVVKAGGDDPFVVVEPPVKMTEAELDQMSSRLSAQKPEAGIKIRSGYRIPVTVRRDVPGRLPDIGTFEKTVFLTGSGDRVVKVPIKGRVTGLVWLQDMEKIDLKSYSGRLGAEVKAVLTTGKTDLELELLAGETKPEFLRAVLGTPRSEPGSKTWPLTVTAPPNQGFAPYWDGVIVLQTKGPNPQKVRIPVGGHGR